MLKVPENPWVKMLNEGDAQLWGVTVQYSTVPSCPSRVMRLTPLLGLFVGRASKTAFPPRMGACSSRSVGRAATVGPRSSSLDAPAAALVPPGQCVFGEDWSPAKLVARVPMGANSILATFELADPTKPLGLSTCACILAKGAKDADGKDVIRPYTPISTNGLMGKFELLVKVGSQAYQLVSK